MPTSFVKGNVIDAAKSAPGKRVLAFGAESGIAAAVKKEWPAFAGALDGSGMVEPGEAFAWTDEELTLMALGIQRGSAKPKVSWIDRSLKAVIAHAEKDGIARVLLARLGGDWTRVKKVLGELGSGTTVEIVVFEQFVRKTEAD